MVLNKQKVTWAGKVFLRYLRDCIAVHFKDKQHPLVGWSALFLEFWHSSTFMDRQWDVIQRVLEEKLSGRANVDFLLTRFIRLVCSEEALPLSSWVSLLEDAQKVLVPDHQLLSHISNQVSYIHLTSEDYTAVERLYHKSGLDQILQSSGRPPLVQDFYQVLHLAQAHLALGKVRPAIVLLTNAMNLMEQHIPVLNSRISLLQNCVNTLAHYGHFDVLKPFQEKLDHWIRIRDDTVRRDYERMYQEVKEDLETSLFQQSCPHAPNSDM